MKCIDHVPHRRVLPPLWPRPFNAAAPEHGADGRRVRAVFYGHPGVFAFPSNESVRREREQGHMGRIQRRSRPEAALAFLLDVGIVGVKGGGRVQVGERVGDAAERAVGDGAVVAKRGVIT